MFLIQSESKTVLYTGDIRAEPWWVQSLKRHPVMIPFSTGLQKIDRVYLDTTFATKSKAHQHFPTKMEGIGELLKKVAQYPPTTIFHFHAWTSGYEDVWYALSSALDCQVGRSPKERLANGLLTKVGSC